MKAKKCKICKKVFDPVRELQLVCSAKCGYKYVNMEQDLGIDGLRRAKRSYHPAFMIKKYTLEYKGKR